MHDDTAYAGMLQANSSVIVLFEVNDSVRTYNSRVLVLSGLGPGWISQSAFKRANAQQIE